MIANVLRMAGQRLLPIIAPAGAKQFATEAAKGAALNLALEQGLPLALGQEGRPLPESILRSVSIGALGGPVERGVVAGAKKMFPGISTLEIRATERLAGLGIPSAVATGAAGLAASAGKLGLGTLGQAAFVEPISTAVTRTVFPEGFNGGQNMQTGIQADMAGAAVAPQLGQTGLPVGMMDPAEVAHRRQLELIYARNYKFPSYIHHVSQTNPDPFAIANQMVNVPTANYF